MPGFVFLDFSPTEKTQRTPNALDMKASYADNKGLYIDCSWLLRAAIALESPRTLVGKDEFSRADIQTHYNILVADIRQTCSQCEDIFIFIHGDIGFTESVFVNKDGMSFEIKLSTLLYILRSILIQKKYIFYFIICYGARTERYFIDHDAEIALLSDDELMESVVGRLLKGIYEITKRDMLAIATTSSTGIATQSNHQYIENQSYKNDLDVFKKERFAPISIGHFFGFWERYTLSQCTLRRLGFSQYYSLRDTYNYYERYGKNIDDSFEDDEPEEQSFDSSRLSDLVDMGDDFIPLKKKKEGPPSVPELRQTNFRKHAVSTSGRSLSVGYKNASKDPTEIGRDFNSIDEKNANDFNRKIRKSGSIPNNALREMEYKRLTLGKDYRSSLFQSAQGPSDHFVDVRAHEFNKAVMPGADLVQKFLRNSGEITSKHNCLLYEVTEKFVTIFRIKNPNSPLVPTNLREIRQIRVA